MLSELTKKEKLVVQVEFVKSGLTFTVIFSQYLNPVRYAHRIKILAAEKIIPREYRTALSTQKKPNDHKQY